jgi:hypothetical protein
LPAIEDASAEIIDPFEVVSVQPESGPSATADEQLELLLARHSRGEALIDLNDEQVTTFDNSIPRRSPLSGVTSGGGSSFELIESSSFGVVAVQ